MATGPARRGTGGRFVLSQGPAEDEYSLVGAMTRPVPPRTARSHRMVFLGGWSLTLMLHILGVVLFIWLASHPGSVLHSISNSSRPELVHATLLSADWRSAHSGIAKSKAASVAAKPSTPRVSSPAPSLPVQVVSKPQNSPLTPAQQRRKAKSAPAPSSPDRPMQTLKTGRREQIVTVATPVETAIPVSQADSTVVASKENETNQSVTKPSNASPPKMALEAEASSETVEPGGPIITQARYRGTPIPEEYPLLARRRGWQGTVMVEVWLDVNGEQIRRDILRSSGHALLDQAALRSIARNQFAPYTINGVGQPARLHLPVIYSLTTP